MQFLYSSPSDDGDDVPFQDEANLKDMQLRCTKSIVQYYVILNSPE